MCPAWPVTVVEKSLMRALRLCLAHKGNQITDDRNRNGLLSEQQQERTERNTIVSELDCYHHKGRSIFVKLDPTTEHSFTQFYQRKAESLVIAEEIFAWSGLFRRQHHQIHSRPGLLARPLVPPDLLHPLRQAPKAGGQCVEDEGRRHLHF
jgi:hypothetical protein